MFTDVRAGGSRGTDSVEPAELESVPGATRPCEQQALLTSPRGCLGGGGRLLGRVGALCHLQLSSLYSACRRALAHCKVPLRPPTWEAPPHGRDGKLTPGQSHTLQPCPAALRNSALMFNSLRNLPADLTLAVEATGRMGSRLCRHPTPAPALV